ncbi:MAG: FumA C-terminus/TtdB family hydratase beta subunit [Promethearchaeota archaeon]
MSVYKLKTPISEETIRKLKINDTIYITGIIVTARDSAHRRALEFFKKGEKMPIDLKGLGIFHCGPIIKKEEGKFITIAAGPTTSTRMEIFEDDFIKNFKPRVIIGKGGMGKRTTDAMQKYGGVYGAFTGGAAILASNAMKKVKDVAWVDLGMPEALWILEVENFGPLTVAIDSHGNNLFENVEKKVEQKRKKIYRMLGVST